MYKNENEQGMKENGGEKVKMKSLRVFKVIVIVNKYRKLRWAGIRHGILGIVQRAVFTGPGADFADLKAYLIFVC